MSKTAKKGLLALLLLAGILIGILYHALRMLGGKPSRKSAGELIGRLDAVVLMVLLLGSGVVSGLLPEVPYVGPLITAAAQIVLGGIS